MTSDNFNFGNFSHIFIRAFTKPGMFVDISGIPGQEHHCIISSRYTAFMELCSSNTPQVSSKFEHQGQIYLQHSQFDVFFSLMLFLAIEIDGLTF